MRKSNGQAMTDENGTSPGPSHSGLYEHWCQRPGCKAWGGWGYDRVERGVKTTDWWCYQHRPEAWHSSQRAKVRVVGSLIGPDGMIADEVGSWAKEKHGCLSRYIDISRGVRKQWVSRGDSGTSYIDVFCGTGLSKIRRGDWIDGGAVTAWKTSLEGGSPFTDVFIADRDSEKRKACAVRLRKLGAPVREINGDAIQAAKRISELVNPYGLHFAFIDPYSLEALDFQIINTLSALRHIDMLVHVSKMDLQRNAMANVKSKHLGFDAFAPGWRNAVNTAQPQNKLRLDVFNYWRGLVANLGIWPSTEMKLITGGSNQPLYWLLMAAKHDLAGQFWKQVMDGTGQRGLAL